MTFSISTMPLRPAPAGAGTQAAETVAWTGWQGGSQFLTVINTCYRQLPAGLGVDGRYRFSGVTAQEHERRVHDERLAEETACLPQQVSPPVCFCTLTSAGCGRSSAPRLSALPLACLSFGETAHTWAIFPTWPASFNRCTTLFRFNLIIDMLGLSLLFNFLVSLFPLFLICFLFPVSLSAT